MENLSTVTQIFLFFLITKYMVETFLDQKNAKHIAKNRGAVPEMFSESISLEDHQKAATYSLAKISASRFFNIVEIIILLLWTLGGGLNWLNNWVITFNYSQITSGVVFFAAFSAISSILSLPQSIYTTFFLEEKFGFNKTTPKVFITDMIKGTLLGAIIGLPIIYGILWIMEALGEYWWVYAWAFLTVIQFVLMWAYPTFIAPLFNKFSPMEEGEVKDRVLKLLERTGFKSNGLFVMNASMRSAHGNAYFTGFGNNKRIVFFDTLINTLDADEVEAVLAHELGHFKKKHIVKMLAKGIIFSFIGFAILGALLKSQAFFEGHGVAFPSTYMALILFTMISGVYTFFLTPINSWSSRKHEFEADTYAADNSDANKLITALVKMYRDNASTLTPDPLYSAFYHSHPPALIRVKFLESLLKR